MVAKKEKTEKPKKPTYRTPFSGGLQRIKYRLTLLEPMLGTVTMDPDVYRDFIAGRLAEQMSDQPEELARKIAQELASLPKPPVGDSADEVLSGALAKARTVFRRDDDGNPVIMDYMIRGNMKAAARALARLKGSDAAKDYATPAMSAYIKEIDQLVFVFPRQIVIHAPNGDGQVTVGELTRPLRAQTAQGERVALATSETVPAGCWMDIEVCVLKPELEGAIEEWLSYGALMGLGQWRNASFGRYSWECLTPCDGPAA